MMHGHKDMIIWIRTGHRVHVRSQVLYLTRELLPLEDEEKREKTANHCIFARINQLVISGIFW